MRPIAVLTRGHFPLARPLAVLALGVFTLVALGHRLNAQPTESTASHLPVIIGRPPPPEPLGRILYTIGTPGDFNAYTTVLYSVLPDGTSPRQLTREEDDIQLGRWSPDRRTIAVSRGTPQSPYQLGLLNPVTLAIRPLATPDVDYVGHISWSPDGRTLAFEAILDAGGFDIMAINIDGSNLRNLTAALPTDARSPEWTPDGSAIWFEGFDGGETVLMQMDSDGGDVRPVSDELRSYGAPDWSPDGLTLLLTGRTGGGVAGLFTVPAGGGVPALLLPNAGRGQWSPNGKQIVFVGSDGIYRVDALGQIVVPVVIHSGAAAPDW